MYSVDEIKELLAAFDHSKATKLNIKTADGEELLISEKSKNIVVTSESSAPIVQTATAVATAPAKAEQFDSPFIQPEETTQYDDDSTPVGSPMMGVFYAAPSPDKDPYVQVGSKVNKGDVLCLIEAMKLMNEVTAEKSGEITRVCVENGQVVEFGQPLFMIK